MVADSDTSEPRTGGEGEAAGEVAVNVRCSNGSKFMVRASLGSTVEVFKGLVAQNCDVPAGQQRLIYKGRILKDDQTLESYGLQADHTIHMVRGISSSSTSPAAPAANSETPNTAPGVTRGIGSNNSSNPGASLLHGLQFNPLGGGNSTPGLFGAGLPELEQVQQQLTRDPNMMRDMMNTPAIQGLMNNPELIRTLVMSNPQMRELVDRNPELGHVLNDPSILRQTLEAARNPELMREMVRNTDRAMSNIENTPEGFNMLRRMYENVQEPFLNATTMAGNNEPNTGSNPFAALLGNQGGTQSRDTSNNDSTTGAETGTANTVPNTNPLPNPWGSSGGNQANVTTGVTNPAPETGFGGLGGLGGLGLGELGFPGMGQPTGGMPDASQLNQLFENPAVSQMMQSLLSNPQYMNQVMNSNPQLRSMLDSNPQLRDMMQNPEVLRQLSSPETMQQMLALQQSFFSPSNRTPSSQDSGQTGATTGATNNSGLELLMNMFGGLGTGGLGAPTQSNLPPEELYATQLTQLQEMGFYDTVENIRALRATNGNVNAAVERLLANPGL